MEAPGVMMSKGGRFYCELGWGGLGALKGGPLGGVVDEQLAGGIYMASNISNSCRIWNCTLDRLSEIVGNLGDVEHLRELLGEGEPLNADELIWMTDATPHESVPLPNGGYRQFFRLITSSMSVLFSQHSTANPLGILPDPKITTIVDDDKFKSINRLEKLKGDA